MMRRLASLKLTCAALALLGVCVTAGQLEPAFGREWMALPLVVLALNLCAALACSAALRRRRALALFHVALFAVCVLAALGALTQYEGRVELS